MSILWLKADIQAKNIYNKSKGTLNMYESTLVVNKDSRELERLFASEDKDLNRASYAITKTKTGLIFNIHADDATALKTAFNTITKVLIVWEKTKALK